MLDLEIVPERSLGCEQWEFVLGKFLIFTINVYLLRIIYRYICMYVPFIYYICT